MNFWRLLAALLGASLMVGETIRSFGQGRHPMFVLDDFFIGGGLVAAALLMAKPTPTRCCAFSAAFGAASGMLYGSFFGKLFDPSRPLMSNIDSRLLTALIGLAFTGSLVGLAASLRMANRLLVERKPSSETERR